VLVALNPAYFSLQTLAMIFASSQILCLLALGRWQKRRSVRDS
jgi:AI-2 transport system permease protein